MSDSMSRPVRVRVSGDWACFTRPEMKVERVTYQYMTPSAARGIMEAISWHPEFRWVITQIEVLRPVRYQSVTRNEVQKKIPAGNIPGWVREPDSMKPFYADAVGGKTVKTQPSGALSLCVMSLTTSRVARFVEGSNLRPEDTPEKYAAMFERRVAKGQCFSHPYLGCREFAAEFRPVSPDERPIGETAELGLMLYDIIFSPETKNAANEAVFFKARIEQGVIVTDPLLALPNAAQRDRVISC